MDELVLFWTKEHMVLFVWSLICFSLGSLVTILAYFYYLGLVIRNADRLLQEISVMQRTHYRRRDDNVEVTNERAGPPDRRRREG